MDEGYASSRACIYCGATDNLTTGHVPPKALFGTPRPPDLITVPACLECNQSTTKDEEYLKTVLAIRDDLREHSEVRKILPSVLRSFQRPQAKWFRQGIRNSLCDADIFSAGGVYLRTERGIDVDLTRIAHVGRRIVEGLFYHETNTRLPDTWEADACCLAQWTGLDDDCRQFVRDLITTLTALPLKRLGNNVFCYSFDRHPSEPNHTVWLLGFYDKVWLLGITKPKSQT